MGTSSIFLCILFLGGALGLAASPAQRQLRCYTCNFAKPCYPVPTKCQDDEVCGISIGTSEQSEVIERKGCLPRAECSLQGHTTYWSRSYTLRHHCCEQELCNSATTLLQLPSLLFITLLVLVASFTWGGHQPPVQDSSTVTEALATPAQTLWRSAQEPVCVQRSQIRGPNTFTGSSPNLIPLGIAPAPSCPEVRAQSPAS